MSIFKQLDMYSVEELLCKLHTTGELIISDLNISNNKAQDLIFERNIILTYFELKGLNVVSEIMKNGTDKQRDELMNFKECWCRNPYGYNPYEVSNIEDGVNYYKSIRERD